MSTAEPQETPSWMENRRARLAGAVLSRLASVWPSPVAKKDAELGGDPASDEFHRAYARDQFAGRLASGMAVRAPSLIGKEVLELGCGHGGVSCYLAAIGARRVVGIDVNTSNFRFGKELADSFPTPLPVEYLEMDCRNLTFPNESFDVVYADNAFEHFTEPERVMQEAFRVLRPGGVLLVPTFSSILSKYGLHLKRGLRVPWANLLFSEASIVEAMRQRAKTRPELYEWYPGLGQQPQSVRDLREHRDLNNITHAAFRDMAARCGFTVDTFRVHATLAGKLVRRALPGLEESKLFDVLSTGAGAVLRKP